MAQVLGSSPDWVVGDVVENTYEKLEIVGVVSDDHGNTWLQLSGSSTSFAPQTVLERLGWVKVGRKGSPQTDSFPQRTQGRAETFIQWLESLPPDATVGASGMYGATEGGHPWERFLRETARDLNSPKPECAKVLDQIVYYHPHCDWGGITAQQALDLIQGVNS